MPRTVRLDEKTDRWRYRCPQGHTTWEPTNNHFWCHECARQPALEATFDVLHDLQEDRDLERDELRLVDEFGSYHGRGSA